MLATKEELLKRVEQIKQSSSFKNSDQKKKMLSFFDTFVEFVSTKKGTSGIFAESSLGSEFFAEVLNATCDLVFESGESIYNNIGNLCFHDIKNYPKEIIRNAVFTLLNIGGFRSFTTSSIQDGNLFSIYIDAFETRQEQLDELEKWVSAIDNSGLFQDAVVSSEEYSRALSKLKVNINTKEDFFKAWSEIYPVLSKIKKVRILPNEHIDIDLIKRIKNENEMLDTFTSFFQDSRYKELLYYKRNVTSDLLDAFDNDIEKSLQVTLSYFENIPEIDDYENLGLSGMVSFRTRERDINEFCNKYLKEKPELFSKYIERFAKILTKTPNSIAEVCIIKDYDSSIIASVDNVWQKEEFEFYLKEINPNVKSDIINNFKSPYSSSKKANHHTMRENLTYLKKYYEEHQKPHKRNPVSFENFLTLSNKKLLEKYQRYGVIDKETFNRALEVAKKYNKNLTIEKFKDTVAANPNAKTILEHIASLDRLDNEIIKEIIDGIEVNHIVPNTSGYDKVFQRFEAIFPKTRLQFLPDFHTLNKMDTEFLRKFDVKTYNRFASLPLFNKDENTKRALVEFIAIMGLFEQDKNVEARRANAMKLIEKYAHNFAQLVTTHNIKSLYNTALEKGYSDKDFNQIKQNVYYFKNAQAIPEEIKGFFSEICEHFTFHEILLKELTSMEGSMGKKINDFLTPYVKVKDGYKLKESIEIPEELKNSLKSFLTDKEYSEIINNKFSPASAFVSPLFKLTPTYWMPNAKRIKDTELINNWMDETLLCDDSSGKLNHKSLHRMFDGCKQEFDENVYNFITQNFESILATCERQSGLKIIQKLYGKASVYYKEHGNSKPSYLDVKLFCDSVLFDYDYGRDDFAEEVKRSGVRIQEAYSYYENLLNKLEKRTKSTIPRHEKVYDYKAKDGTAHKVLVKILRCDDPMNMLVGESAFTNCCQVYSNAGQSCMEHAATNKSGGILATYLVSENDELNMLTQSWIWTNETLLCLDNVEATSMITENKKGKLYQDIVKFGLKKAGEDILETSEKAISEFINEKKKHIENSKLSGVEKEKQFKRLSQFQQRQTLKTITVGLGCDDVNIKDTFEKELTEVYLPKNYSSYSDAKIQRVIASKDSEINKNQSEEVDVSNKLLNEDYEEVPIYRDNRRIISEQGNAIASSTLRQLTVIESQSQIGSKLEFMKNNKPVLKSVSKLAKIYGCKPENLRIVFGEDWYGIYEISKDKIQIHDTLKSSPRNEDEIELQKDEIRKFFHKILESAFVPDENGIITKAKTINTRFRDKDLQALFEITIANKSEMQSPIKTEESEQKKVYEIITDISNPNISK